MTLTLSNETERRIRRLVESGRFESPDEVVEAAVGALDAAFAAGLESFATYARSLDPAARSKLENAVDASIRDLDAGKGSDGDAAMASARSLVANKALDRS